MVQIEDQNRTILDFCDKAQPTLLVFHVNPAGNLVRGLEWLSLQTETFDFYLLQVVGTAFPASLKTKACFFAKKLPEPLQRESKEKVTSALNFGDLSNAALEQLQIYVNDVISFVFPLLIHLS